MLELVNYLINFAILKIDAIANFRKILAKLRPFRTLSGTSIHIIGLEIMIHS